jgi:Protein of unknown function (DUF2958)
MGNYQVRFRGRGRGQSLREPSPLPDEIDPDDEARCFGLCDLGLGCPEMGWADPPEIEALRGPLRLPVERDLYFRAGKPLSGYAREARLAGRIVT